MVEVCLFPIETCNIGLTTSQPTNRPCANRQERPIARTMACALTSTGWWAHLVHFQCRVGLSLLHGGCAAASHQVDLGGVPRVCGQNVGVQAVPQRRERLALRQECRAGLQGGQMRDAHTCTAQACSTLTASVNERCLLSAETLFAQGPCKLHGQLHCQARAAGGAPA